VLIDRIKKWKFAELHKRAELATKFVAIDDILTGVEKAKQKVDTANLVRSIDLETAIKNRSRIRALIDSDSLHKSVVVPQASRLFATNIGDSQQAQR
jgi:hypothetical protein